ncbi:putative mannose-1-phosphate guanyltransferase [Proteiniborus sp. DW1]|uniref:nucleotidyltransferase family protein n=1 Tax=Proteiniborus sp. DW1 TaxID=1889883 RepID=UPI00092E194C|nr:nucleotidyltransferase family protein [Proteiniborus sp. DW1]SCG83149.1 putative mannose-1-phosphate guanyltransferase [Proteiniborus sp. DW1]
MEEWKKVLVSPQFKVHETIKIIDLHSLQIALVVSQDNKLLGTVTDGDIRRGLLNGISLDDTIEKIMNRNPITIRENKNKKNILEIFKINKIRHLPIVDDAGHVIGIHRIDDLLHTSKKENWIILMAGGLGSRLRPLTDNCPKPMLLIGEKPLLEITLNQLREQGFYRFCFSINYKGKKIKDYFGDGSKWGVEIYYIHEEIPLGTAGSLSLFQVETDSPIIVINADILTKVNFEQLVNFHIERQAEATIAVRSFDFQVPYGVVKINQDTLIGFEEKPVFTNFINAGIYVLNPSVLCKIPRNSYYDMNQLFEIMLSNNEKISVFPVREYWMDIGRIEDFNQAKFDFNEVFR